MPSPGSAGAARVTRSSASPMVQSEKKPSFCRTACTTVSPGAKSTATTAPVASTADRVMGSDTVQVAGKAATSGHR